MNYVFTLWLGFFGLLFGRLPGLISGAVIGLVLDNLRYNRRRNVTPEAGGFVGPLFTLLGAVAKSDGRISEQEIAVAERLMTRMGLDADQRKQAIASFNRGKQPEFNVGPPIAELRQWAGLRRDHAFPILDVVIETVFAEGEPPPAKMAILRQLAFALHISDMELTALLAMRGYAWNAGPRGPDRNGQRRQQGQRSHQYQPPRPTPRGPDPYAVLGVARDADERTIKRAWRKLMSEHHPDRLGDLPEAMRRQAEARASEINTAYGRIKELRGFK